MVRETVSRSRLGSERSVELWRRARPLSTTGAIGAVLRDFAVWTPRSSSVEIRRMPASVAISSPCRSSSPRS
jgi:hypothetical protein